MNAQKIQICVILTKSVLICWAALNVNGLNVHVIIFLTGPLKSKMNSF